MKLKVETDLVQKKTHIILGNGHIGVNVEDMAGNVAKVKSNPSKKVNYIKGDANIEDICHVGAHRTSFFSNF